MNLNNTITLPKLPKKYKLLIGLLGFIGVVFIFLSTNNYGAALSTDSVVYISIARNIMVGKGVVSYNGAPLIEQPPLYPALLALISLITGKDPLLLVRGVNAFIFGLLICFAGLLILRHLMYFPILAILGIFAVIFSSPLWLVSVYALSEPLFIFFMLLSFIFVDLYIAKNDKSSLIFLSISIALSCLTRYIGVALILWGAMIVLIFSHDKLKSRITNLILFILFSAVPLGIWFFRNYAISGTLSGYHASSAYTSSQNLVFTCGTLLNWIVPSKISINRPIMIFLTAFMFFILAFSFKDIWRNAKITMKQTAPIALFVFTYIIFLVIAATTSAYDRIGDRLLSPVYIPLTLLLLVAVREVVKSYRKRFSRNIVNILIIFGIIIWLIYPIRSTLLRTIELAQNGYGYSGKMWLESETLQYVNQYLSQDSSCVIYSNDPYVIYILSDIKAKMSLLKTWYHSPEMANDILKMKGNWPKENNACIVWFDSIDRKYLFAVEELREIADIDLIIQLSDGAIYSVARK